MNNSLKHYVKEIFSHIVLIHTIHNCTDRLKNRKIHFRNSYHDATYLFCNQRAMELVKMTSWHGYAFRVISPLWGESTGHGSITLTKDQYFGCDGVLFGVGLIHRQKWVLWASEIWPDFSLKLILIGDKVKICRIIGCETVSVDLCCLGPCLLTDRQAIFSDYDACFRTISW